MFAASFAGLNDLSYENQTNHLKKQNYEKNPNFITGW